MRFNDMVGIAAIFAAGMWYGACLMNWAKEDQKQVQDQKTLVRMHQQAKKLQKASWKEEMQEGVKDEKK